jgi:hypothetical protein
LLFLAVFPDDPGSGPASEGIFAKAIKPFAEINRLVVNPLALQAEWVYTAASPRLGQ